MCTSAVISSYVAQIFSFLSTSIVPKVDVLVRQIDLSESIIASVSYISIAPFFVDCGPMVDLPSNTKSKKVSQDNGSMKAMRLECLKLLRNVKIIHNRIIHSMLQNSFTLIAVLINTGFGEISRPERLDH